MNENFDERLDAALDMQQSAAPDGDAELGELLQVAAAVRADAARVRPSADGMRRGRARLMAEVNAQRRALGGSSTWLQALGALLVPALRGKRLALALVFVMAVAVSSRVLSVSAESLPGDPLYDLKRLQEQVTLTLTLDEQAQASLRDEYAQQRAREWQQVQQQHRITRAQLEGIVEQVSENALTVSGLTMRLDRAALGDQRWLQAGVRVSVVVQSNADSSLEAVSLTLLPALTLPSSAPVLSATPSPRDTTEATRIPAGQTPAEPTRTPGATSPSTAQPERTVEPTRKPEVTREDNGTLTPVATRRSDATRGAEATQTPQPTGTPEARATQPPTAQPTRVPEATRTEEPELTPTLGVTATRQPEPTQTPRPTQTAQSSPRPTQTVDAPQSVPTATPRPTQTQDSGEATQTPEPTRTPTPPTPTRTPESTGTSSPSR